MPLASNKNVATHPACLREQFVSRLPVLAGCQGLCKPSWVVAAGSWLLARHPSTPHCRAWRRPEAASAACSRPPEPSVAEPGDIHPAEAALPVVIEASLTPCLRHRSATDTPASCSFKIPMISSEKRLRFMSWSSRWARTNVNRIRSAGQGHRMSAMNTPTRLHCWK